MSRSEHRERIEHELGRPMQKVVWDQLQSEPEYEAFAGSPSDSFFLGEVADRAQILIDVRAVEIEERRLRSELSPSYSEHATALAAALSAKARAQADGLLAGDREMEHLVAQVAAFRSEVIGEADFPLSVEQIDGWARDRSAPDADVTASLSIPLPDGNYTRAAGYVAGTGSALEQLDNLSARLAAVWRWSRAAAVAFVLSDATPIVYPIQGQSSSDYVTLTIHKESSVEDVVAVYRDARGARGRALQSSTLWAAVSAARFAARSWEAQRRRHVERHAGSFRDWRSFRRSARNALRRL
jgi:hypothetical protein